MDKTVMLFRVWRGGVIAVMPYEVADPTPDTSMSYQHVGQHGACDPVGIVSESRPARPEEYDPLLTELRSIGYEVEVVEALPPDARGVRAKQLAAVR